MKNHMIGLLLALCLVLGLLPGTAAAAQAHPLPQAQMAAQDPGGERLSPMAGSYAITMTATGPGVAELYSTRANAGDRIYFLADPDPGYRVSFEKCGYYKQDRELELYYIGSNVYEIVMPDGDVVLELEFVPIGTESHPVTMAVGGDGMVTVSQTQAGAGESIFLEVITGSGGLLQGFVQASAGGTEVEVHALGRMAGTELFEIFMPDAPLQISVQFEVNGPFPVDTIVFSGTEESGGRLELSRSQACEGEFVTVTAVPDRGWEVFDICTRNHAELTQVGENTWTFLMTGSDEEVWASFAKISYPVTVTVEEPVGGTAVLDADAATVGQTVTLTCTPDPGYRVARVETAAELTDNGDGTYTFVVDTEPVELSVLFLRESNPFLDVNESHFYHDSVLWAVEKGITNGIDGEHFGPFGVCNRAQVVTFLWRAAGCPGGGAGNPFADVADDAWYAEAVLWAVEQGITNGLTETTFGPDEICNRAQVVTFLWRAMGSPESGETHPFTDVEAGSWYEAPVLWALENGITTGVAEDSFGPTGQCLRAQVVTFLHRADGPTE